MPLFPFGTIGFGALALEVTADNVSGSGQDFTQCGIAAASGPNCQVSGGSGSYTFLWTQTGTPAERGPYDIFSDTLQNPFWRKQVCDNDTPKAETWTVTVTDTVTLQEASTAISVLLTWVNLN